jgi:hypothetical protein
MTPASRFLLRISGAIAGTDRADWTKAMAAESAHADNSFRWALGCLWASAKDRWAREWRFLLAILAFPIGAYLLELAVFYPVAWLSQHDWVPGWVLVGTGLFSPLPFAFVLGRMRPGPPAYLGSLISFPIGIFVPLVLFWIEFGKSPFSWFGDDATWFMMSPITGLICALLVWLGGVWLGTTWGRRHG